MSDFDEEYHKLNSAQKAAVDTIYGPVMVVAGPGTGKTQLLSMRVANILRHSDVLPRNILCLTFTESAATAMRERLLGLIGIDASKVAIHTFHSFGVEVINQHPQYFYNGARFAPSDGVLQIEIVEEILRGLSHDNPLTSVMNDKFVHLHAIIRAIGDLKKAGLSPSELRTILGSNAAAIQAMEPLLQDVFDVPRFGKSHLPRLREALETLPATESPGLPEPFQPLEEVVRHSLEMAVSEAEETGSTKPVTAWKNTWMHKDEHKRYVFKDGSRMEHMQALADVYERYQAELTRRERYDFADMVLHVLEGLEHYPQLRYELQEQYQFVLVDEFQDTNDAQLRILYALADNPVHEGSPDIMVVGDDDQAIYKFQGAEINNILHFQDVHSELQTVTLRDNYRSRQEILDTARSVIRQGEVRLESALDHIDKTLRAAGSPSAGHITYTRLETPLHEYTWVASRVKELIDSGTPARDIAIIGRQHSSLEALMPHLREAGVPVVYERRHNILEEPHIAQLISMAYAVQRLADGEHREANAYISQILSFPFWGIDTIELWRVSRHAYEERRFWVDILLESDNRKLRSIAHFLLECAQLAASEPLEYVLDRLIGSRSGEEFTSPYREYHFSEERFQSNRGEYITFLSALRLLRDRLHEYRRRETIYLRDLIEYVQLHQDNDMPIVDETPFVSSEDAVWVMTAHKAKGQEYDTVFIINAQESVWARSGGRQQLPFPGNLPLTPAGDALDDQLRLLFVAMTRAKSNLHISGYTHDSRGKESLLVPFLEHEKFQHETLATETVEEALEHTWQSYYPLPRHSDAQAVLKPVLDTYQLNVTHFLKFLDLAEAGPHTFLLESLLQFPQAPAASAAYGTAVHATLKEAYQYIQHGNPLGVDALLEAFKSMLVEQRMREDDFYKYLERGKKELGKYLEQRYETFAPEHLIETDFKSQGVTVNGARLTGKIDKMILNQDKTCAVYDFKTGKPFREWPGGRDKEAVKAWRYRVQLIFYKLLVEHSRSWSDYRVDRGVLEFIRPHREEVVLLPYDMDHSEVERITDLIQAVWQRIQRLDFPDTDHYSRDLTGIRQFEDDLLAAD